MDPNETLRALRGAVRHMQEVGHELDARENQCVSTVADLFTELDAHLTAGGKPPEEWVEGPDAIGTVQDEASASIQGPDAAFEPDFGRPELSAGDCTCDRPGGVHVWPCPWWFRQAADAMEE